MPAIVSQAILRSIIRNTPMIWNSVRNRKRHLTSFCHRMIPVKTVGTYKKKLTSLKELRAEYTQLLCEKKAAYPEYYKAKLEYRDQLTYLGNLVGLFGIENVRAEQQKER